MLDWQKAIDISPLISEKIAVFPGDQAFTRKVLMDVDHKDHLTLSSIQTTVHLGAHTDAPNHYAKNSVGIDEVGFEAYLGPCQVIHITRLEDNLITPDSIDDNIQASRVLFKTNSFPNPDVWNADFAAFAPETIEYLNNCNVKLVGIDTPSIDPATSKTLDSHHKVAENKMAILEGIVLSHVKPGLYELIALPLKIKNCDASPVRAILLPR